MGNIAEFQKPEDMTLEETEQLARYMQNGLPGITKVVESDIFKWFELYMSGKTYDEIAVIEKAKKDKILYMSHKHKWHEKRMQHYNDLIQNLTSKITHTKISSINTVSTIISALNKYYGKKFNKYIANNDESIIEGIDTKLLTQYYKSMDTIDKLATESSKQTEEGKDGKNPMVNINMMGGTVKQLDENTLEITEENAGDFLKALAGMKKKESESD